MENIAKDTKNGNVVNIWHRAHNNSTSFHARYFFPSRICTQNALRASDLIAIVSHMEERGQHSNSWEISGRQFQPFGSASNANRAKFAL
jgi:hypothetical protein